MESNADTYEVETSGATREGSSRPSNRRTALTWGAVAAAGVAVAAFSFTTLSGGDDGGGSLTTQRAAQLSGQASEQRCPAAGSDTPAPEYLPGTRHVPAR